MIKGITDRTKISLPRLAKIRLGVRSSTGGYPQDTDHFVLTDCPEVAEVYGPTPNKLIAMFASDDPEVNFFTRAEAWKASSKPIPGTTKPKSSLFCSSDGETATRVHRGAADEQGHAMVLSMPEDERPELGEMFQMPCLLESCPYYEDRSCKPVGRLNFFLPQVTWRGLYQIETSSLYAFGNIKQFFNLLSFVNRAKMAGIPFELSRKPIVTSPEHLKGKTVVKHILHLEIPQIRPTILPPPFILGNVELPSAERDIPEELFPAKETKSIPASASERPAVDDLAVMANVAGLDPKAFAKLKYKHKGDVEAIRKELKEEMEKKESIDEALPASAQDDKLPIEW